MLNRIWNHLIALLGLNKAISFTVAGQIIQAGLLPVSLILVASSLTKTEQGFYFTFASIVALQVFIELGFTQCIYQFASHEFAGLNFSDDAKKPLFVGNKYNLERMASLFGLTIKWYFYAASALAVLLVISGWIVFRGNEDVNWKIPWVTLSVATALMLVLESMWALIEGCNQVASVTGVRAVVNCTKWVALCIGLFFGLKLFSVALSIFAALLVSAFFLLFRWRSSLLQLLQIKNPNCKVSWVNEIWPLQWRLAISWIAGFFIFPILNPLLFTMQGPITAGQFGMTWAIMQAAASFGRAWIRTSSPAVSIAVAQQNWNQADTIWRQAAIRHIGFCAFVIFGVCFCLGVSTNVGLSFPHRMLTWNIALVIGVATILNEIVLAMAFFLRAHKKEPYMWLSVFGACLVLIIVPISTKYFGVSGTSWGFLVSTAIGFPMAVNIFVVSRSQYRAVS